MIIRCVCFNYDILGKLGVLRIETDLYNDKYGKTASLSIILYDWFSVYNDLIPTNLGNGKGSEKCLNFCHKNRMEISSV